jgi:hypothetical protein
MDTPVPAPRTIHHSELGPAQRGSPLTQAWDTYRREVARLLAEGHEGKHVLIKDEEIIGLFDTREQALDEGYARFLVPRLAFLVHQIKTYERVSRISCYLFSCPTSL